MPDFAHARSNSKGLAPEAGTFAWSATSLRYFDPSKEPATAVSEAALLRRVFDSLREEDVNCCLLRGFNKLSSRRPAGDFDLLLHPAHAQLFRQILFVHGFLAFGTPAGSNCLYIAYDQADDSWIKLDVSGYIRCHTRMLTLPTHLAESCLRGRRWRPPVFTPAPEDEFISLLLHCLTEKRRFKPSHAERLSTLHMEISSQRAAKTRLAEYLNALLPNSLARVFEQAAATGDWQRLLRSHRVVTRRLFRLNRGESYSCTASRISSWFKWLLSGGNSQQSVVVAWTSTDKSFGPELKRLLTGAAYAAVYLCPAADVLVVSPRLSPSRFIQRLRLRYQNFRGRVLVVEVSTKSLATEPSRLPDWLRPGLLVFGEPPTSDPADAFTIDTKDQQQSSREDQFQIPVIHSNGSPEEMRQAVMYGIWSHLKARYLTSGKGPGGKLNFC